MLGQSCRGQPVCSILKTAEDFYVGLVGFDVTQRTYPGALFVAAGGYHHHIGLNVWSSRGAPSPPANAVGLRMVTARVTNAAAFTELTERRHTLGLAGNAVGQSVRLWSEVEPGNRNRRTGCGGDGQHYGECRVHQARVVRLSFVGIQWEGAPKGGRLSTKHKGVWALLRLTRIVGCVDHCRLGDNGVLDKTWLVCNYSASESKPPKIHHRFTDWRRMIGRDRILFMGFQIQRKERVFLSSYHFVSSQLICESVVNFSLSRILSNLRFDLSFE